MIIGKNDFETFKKAIKEKKLFLFGASDYLRLINLFFRDLSLDKSSICVIDNDLDKQGKAYDFGEKSIPIASYDYLINQNPDDIVILISSSAYAYEIYEQLEADERLKGVLCFFLMYLVTERSDIDAKFAEVWDKKNGTPIPKILHCFWFSGGDKTELAARCLDSWRKACPDYEIMEWNSENYDVSKNQYMYEAYKMRKWAFATDYARLDIINQYGGFYLDLDVELYKELEQIRYHDFVVGFGPYREVEAAVFGAKKNNEIIACLMDFYRDKTFDMNKVVRGETQPYYLTKIFNQMGFELDGRYIEKEGVAIYPKEVFSNRNFYTKEIYESEYALGVHHCDGSWLEKKSVEDRERSKEALINIRKLYGKGI